MKTILVFLFMPFLLFGQESADFKKWYVGSSFAADYDYRISKPEPKVQSTANFFDSLGIPKFGFTTGFSIGYRINRRLNLESGLFYTDKGYKECEFALYNHMMPTNGVVQPSFYFSAAYHHVFLDIPVKVNYNILTGRTKLYGSAGISTNFLLSQYTILRKRYPDGHTIKDKSYSDTGNFLNSAFLAGFGVSHALSEKWFARLEALYRQIIFSEAPYHKRLFSVGLRAGVL